LRCGCSYAQHFARLEIDAITSLANVPKNACVPDIAGDAPV